MIMQKIEEMEVKELKKGVIQIVTVIEMMVNLVLETSEAKLLKIKELMADKVIIVTIDLIEVKILMFRVTMEVLIEILF